MREYEFSRDQAEQVRFFYKILFGLFALLLVSHVGVIGSALPNVYSDQEATVCGARKLIGFVSHRFGIVCAVFLMSSALLLATAVLVPVSLQARVTLMVGIVLLGMSIMLLIGYVELHWASRLPRLPQDVHTCAYPANAVAW